jgi:hypothetical protein
LDLIQFLALAGSIGIFLFIVEMIRRDRLKERYSLLWLMAGSVLIIISSTRDILHYIAELFGVFYPPSLLFIIAFVFLLLINLHFSLVISSLTEKNRRLAQEITILNLRISEIEKSSIQRS